MYSMIVRMITLWCCWGGCSLKPEPCPTLFGSQVSESCLGTAIITIGFKTIWLQHQHLKTFVYTEACVLVCQTLLKERPDQAARFEEARPSGEFPRRCKCTLLLAQEGCKALTFIARQSKQTTRLPPCFPSLLCFRTVTRCKKCSKCLWLSELL